MIKFHFNRWYFPLFIFFILLSFLTFSLACSNPFGSDPFGSDDSSTVYITNTGSKYHRSDCRYLSSSKIAISLGEAKDRGYTPCSVCKPPQ